MKPLVLSFSTSRYSNRTFGDYIKKTRLKKGLKQVDVAKAIGVNEITIMDWDRSPESPRSSPLIAPIAAAVFMASPTRLLKLPLIPSTKEDDT